MDDLIIPSPPSDNVHIAVQGGRRTYKTSLQRGKDRVRAATERHQSTTNPTRQWAPCKQVGGSERGWLRELDPHSERYSSTIIASELVLKQVYTETGRGGDVVGGPCKKRTAVAVTLLYHLSGFFQQYQDLMKCLLRDLVGSIYVQVEHDAGALWDCLCSSGEDFFRRRACYEANEFDAKPTYFEEHRTMKTALERYTKERNLLYTCRGALCLTLDAVLRRRDADTQKLVLRWWWAFTRIEGHYKRTNTRKQRQMSNAVKMSWTRRLVAMQRRCFTALRANVMETRSGKMSIVRNSLDLIKAELVVVKNESRMCVDKYYQCLRMWEAWAHNVVSLYEDSDTEDTGVIESKNIESTASYKKRFEGLTQMIRHGIKADLLAANAPPPVPPLKGAPGRREAVAVLAQHQQLINTLFHAYSAKLCGVYVVSLFDVSRMIDDCLLTAHRATMLHCASVAAGKRDVSPILLPADGFQEFLFESAVLTMEHDSVEGKMTALVCSIAGRVDRFSTPDLFDNVLRDPEVLNMSVKMLQDLVPFCKTKGLNAEYVNGLEIQHLRADQVDAVFDRLPSEDLQDVDYLTVTLALAMLNDPMPFTPPDEKWATFSLLLQVAQGDTAARKFKKLLKRTDATPQAASKPRAALRRNISK